MRIERKTKARPPSYRTDGVRGNLRVGNQIKERKAHDQEDNEPLDPGHVGLVILPVFTADYSNTLPLVQTGASMLSFLCREHEKTRGRSDAC